MAKARVEEIEIGMSHTFKEAAAKVKRNFQAGKAKIMCQRLHPLHLSLKKAPNEKKERINGGSTGAAKHLLVRKRRKGNRSKKPQVWMMLIPVK